MTASLLLSLGGWAADHTSQRSALELATTNPVAGAAALDELGVMDSSRLAERLGELRSLLDGERYEQCLDLLALSPDPAAAGQALVTLWEHGEAEALSAGALTAFVTLASQSRFLGRFLARRPSALQMLADSAALVGARTGGEFDAAARELLERHHDTLCDDLTPFAHDLRELRTVELARIFYREVIGLADVEVTGRELSQLADACIDAALDAARRYEAQRAELPPGRPSMSVIGLGKLGSMELNFSSDVDVLFLAGDEVTSDPALARLGEAVAQRTRDLLDSPMPNGHVFRVDLRLRPDGTRGPLVAFPRGLRDYYSRVARGWERAALLRARRVAGDAEPAREAFEMLEPIRHPRSVDPSTVEALRAMKDHIDRHESWRSATRRIATGWDVKVGVGGIREVEFVVAAFQVVLAGREPSLRGVSTYEGLGRIAALGGLDPADAHDLDEAYRFYRRVEHRLQMDEDRQTHRLPTEPVERARLARRLGFVDWEALDRRLDAHRDRVREVFERTLASRPAPRDRREADEILDAVVDLVDGGASADEVTERLEAAGFARPRSALGAFRVLWKQPRGPLSAAGLKGADRMASHLIDSVLAAPDPDAALIHLTDLLTHPHSGALLEYLRAKPATLRSVMTLLGTSDYLAHKLTRSPWWIERLLGSGTHVLQSRAHLEEGWQRMRARARNLEGRLNLLRRFKASQEVRIAMAYLEGVIDDDQLADQLVLVAEHVVAHTLEEARADLADAGELDRFAVIAMGRFGALELGFGSDLDLIFVFDGPVDAAPRYGRLARRLIHFLNTPMADGILYHVDLRLRPYGGKGTVVTTLARFAEYYAQRAEAWERVAMVRGRPVVAPDDLATRFRQVRQRICRLDAAETAAVAERVDAIRQRLRNELVRPRSGSYHLKYGDGGLMEIELVTQLRYMVAAGRSTDGHDGPDSPRLLSIMDWLEAVGAQSPEDTLTLRDAYVFYRRLQNVLRLTQDRSVDEFAPADPALRRLRQLMARQAPELAHPKDLANAVEQIQGRVSRVYQRTLAELSGASTRGAP